METDEVDTRQEQPKDYRVIFAPLEEIRNIESVIDKLETTRRELQKVMEGMKPVVN